MKCGIGMAALVAFAQRACQIASRAVCLKQLFPNPCSMLEDSDPLSSGPHPMSTGAGFSVKRSRLMLDFDSIRTNSARGGSTRRHSFFGTPISACAMSIDLCPESQIGGLLRPQVGSKLLYCSLVTRS